ncbi:MAG: Gfo/Idh/MocA family oxidoreductase [Magnetococcales bacterium]|nr:Gfo/Idh/MocA family oxidoreductase [Magnetococcales bacterium]
MTAASSHIDPTALVHPSAIIGRGVAIWNWTKVREGARIGDSCSIGQGVYIDYGVTLGSGCKIQNGVNVYHGVTVGNNVFIGPNATFTNDLYPRAGEGDWTVVPTQVEDGASIGANATIVCGITLGRHCMVAAGAVVIHNVPPHGLVMGQPAKLVDYVNIQGRRLYHDMSGPPPSEAALTTRLPVGHGIMAINPKKKLRMAVVGAGEMGRNHLRVLDLLKGVEIIAVVDRDGDRAREAAHRYGCLPLTDLDGLPGRVDAAIVATPTATHGAIGVWLLDHGIHCLVEKPLAATEDECRALIQAAERSRAVLLPGNIERFNPVVRQLAEILAHGHRIYAVDVHRMSAVSPETTHVAVVEDLMLHDLDIVLSLIPDALTSLSAQAVQRDPEGDPDHATALLAFGDRSIATLTASRITQNKVRQMNLNTDLGFITLDFNAQELLIYQQGHGALDRARRTGLGGLALDLSIERLLIEKMEPLMVELQHFINVVHGKSPPLVTGEHALKVIRLLARIQAACRRGATLAETGS